MTKHSAIMDKHDPNKKVALYVDEVGHLVRPRSRAATRASCISKTHCVTRSVASLTLDIFHRHADRVANGKHRADGERVAGDDPHRQGEDDADADVSRVRDVHLLQGATSAADGSAVADVFAWRMVVAAGVGVRRRVMRMGSCRLRSLTWTRTKAATVSAKINGVNVKSANGPHSHRVCARCAEYV